jgi:hypothetical protein
LAGVNYFFRPAVLIVAGHRFDDEYSYGLLSLLEPASPHRGCRRPTRLNSGRRSLHGYDGLQTLQHTSDSVMQRIASLTARTITMPGQRRKSCLSIMGINAAGIISTL